MNVREDIPLAPYTTFRMGPVAKYVIDIERTEDLTDAFAFINEHALPFFILGGGSNTIFTQNEFPGVVLRILIPGFAVKDELVRIGAGEEWDQVVARTVGLGLSGIEALSAIPGSAGATPIQNVGAYGTEIADVLESVEVYDRATGKVKELSKDECGFSYRTSMFKHTDAYVITAITLRLSKEKPQVPAYPGVAAYFNEHHITEPSLTDIREAIIAIRKTKLPDPKEIASVGSFFKNPIVEREVADRIRTEFPDAVIFETNGGYKIGAGWLIDTLGLKGKSFGNLGLYSHNALVVTNNGEATYAELAEVIATIQEQVRSHFGINLEVEPTFI